MLCTPCSHPAGFCLTPSGFPSNEINLLNVNEPGWNNNIQQIIYIRPRRKVSSVFGQNAEFILLNQLRNYKYNFIITLRVITMPFQMDNWVQNTLWWYTWVFWREKFFFRFLRCAYSASQPACELLMVSHTFHSFLPVCFKTSFSSSKENNSPQLNKLWTIFPPRLPSCFS